MDAHIGVYAAERRGEGRGRKRGHRQGSGGDRGRRTARPGGLPGRFHGAGSGGSGFAPGGHFRPLHRGGPGCGRLRAGRKERCGGRGPRRSAHTEGEMIPAPSQKRDDHQGDGAYENHFHPDSRPPPYRSRVRPAFSVRGRMRHHRRRDCRARMGGGNRGLRRRSLRLSGLRSRNGRGGIRCGGRFARPGPGGADQAGQVVRIESQEGCVVADEAARLSDRGDRAEIVGFDRLKVLEADVGESLDFFQGQAEGFALLT
jgi:hypothetical protein